MKLLGMRVNRTLQYDIEGSTKEPRLLKAPTEYIWNLAVVSDIVGRSHPLRDECLTSQR